MDGWLGLKTEARSIARRFHLTPAINRVQRALPGGRKYEAKFTTAARAAIREGDTVWDIGANVGLYTTRFSDWVGKEGHVIAIEPVPHCFTALKERTGELGNVTVLNAALGDTHGELSMHLAEDPWGATHTFLANDESGATIEVAVCPGDSLLESEGVPPPDVIKVDVEGFEPEVLRGLDTSLRRTGCRAVLCEIHFGLLESRGQKQAPAAIQDFLTTRGFAVKWIDASHLGAYRRSV